MPDDPRARWMAALPNGPDGTDGPPRDELSRRSFAKLLGASVALAGIGACTREPAERILPYVKAPPELTPGVAQHYATAMVLDGYATGLVVESHEGRPTKVEGNPDHPASLGAAGVYEQASILQLYDPHRARAPRIGRATTTWAALARSLAPASLRGRVGARGTGLHLLLEPTASPLVGTLLARLRTAYPDAVVHWHAPLASDAPLAGAREALGADVVAQHDFRRADVILAVDADFLAAMPFHLRYARDFAERRRIAHPSDAMNRLYVAESALSPTGTMADHRLRARPAELPGVLAAVLAAVLRDGAAGAPALPEVPNVPDDAAHAAWARAVAADLRAARGRSVVIVGERQPAAVHAMAHLLNAALGNVGTTVWYTASPLVDAGQGAPTLAPLVDAIRARQVDTLVVLEGNPVYAAPGDLEFARWLRTVPHAVYLGAYADETAAAVQSFVPAAHYLEAWGDARAYDGTASIVQPLVAPLHDGRTPAELLSALVDDTPRGAHALVQDAWRATLGATAAGAAFDAWWDESVRRGVVPDTAAARLTPAPRWDTLPALLAASRAAASAPATLAVVFARGRGVHDGRFANNAWLQELPDPITTLTWDNAAELSPATAARLGVATGDVLALERGARRLRIPALVVPGHADDTIVLALGYGRRGDEAVARDVGVAVSALRTADAPLVADGVTARRALGADGAPLTRTLALTQTHWQMEGRPIVRQTTLAEYRSEPAVPPRRGRVLSLYEPPPPTNVPASEAGPDAAAGAQWAMTIDLSLCTGCSACVVACQAENNVPVVGRDGVLESREMHWLRIDRYLDGPPDAPDVLHQPMLCQHCEKAPCEYVCPVGATTHSDDGLNEMVYNRCVGTRFCSNNCPYKVRRFNWFDYEAALSPTEALAKNPDVTVRDRGVMEKCTFCVQRIRGAQIDARVAGRALRPGEVRTACQQACPTNAIVFGSLTEPDSEVAQLSREPRAYRVLEDLATEPRVRYLARVTNPNPGLG